MVILVASAARAVSCLWDKIPKGDVVVVVLVLVAVAVVVADEKGDKDVLEGVDNVKAWAEYWLTARAKQRADDKNFIFGDVVIVFYCLFFDEKCVNQGEAS